MLEAEARWLRARLAELGDGELSPVLNLGSSDLRFRTVLQPWIDREVFAPLRARGVAVVHCDLKARPGVDVVADALADEGLRALQDIGARAVLCCNMFEHVPDRAALARACAALVPSGGALIVTVPASYPYHPDPIDTYYRPEPEDMSRELFPELTVVRAEAVVGPSYAPELLRRPWLVVRDVARLPALARSPGGLSGSRLGWLGRPYRVSCALLRKG